MADTVQNVLDAVRTEAGFDVTESTALTWVSRKFVQMATEAEAYRVTVAVGSTVADQAFYEFAPVRAFSFEVDGVPYGPGRRPDMYASQQGRLWVTPDGAGLIVADADATGDKGIRLVPTPTEAGLAITSFAAMKPAALTNDAAGDALLLLVLEDEFTEELIAGAMAVGLGRVRRRPDLAAQYEAVFMGGVERLKLRAKRRFRGAGPHQIRILGVNA